MKNFLSGLVFLLVALLLEPKQATNTTLLVHNNSPGYCSEDETFTCTETGRFRNPRDFSCQSYYYCYEWTNGTVGQYNYTCSVGLFNPDTHSCDPAYVCPCSDASAVSTVSTTSPVYCSEDETFTCTETGRFRNPRDFSCQSYYYCYEWTNGTVGQYNYTCAVGLFNPDTHSCDPAYVCPCSDASAVSTVSTTSPVYCSEDETFTCTETGRFRNPRDFSCQSYYYCYEWTNGTVGQYNYTCAVGLFNPDTHSCDPAYVCPCSDATAVSTVSTTSPVYCSEDEIFTCTETGRFRNPRDFSCQSYYYCYEWTNGTIGQYNYTCAVGLFNPDTHSCDPAYVCPCSDATAVSTVSTTSPVYCSEDETFTCTETGRFRNPRDFSCQSYYYCYKWTNGTIGQYNYTCAVGLFNPDTHSCDPAYVCPCSDTTAVSTVSTTSPVYCSEDETFTCTETGRFRNPRDFSCQSYYYCYEWTNGTVGQYNYTCAVGLFNPDTHSCDPAYVCPCSDATAVSTVSTTSPVYCSEDETFTCTETGRFRNPRDFSCQSYYYCYEWTNGTVGQYNYTCAVGLFNPDTHSCDPAYVCPCSDATAVSTVSTTSPVYCSEDETFTCTETGRFRNPRDFSCQSYYYCYEWTNGTVGQYNYTCAVGLFNPDTHSCDPAYVCPCSDATAVSTVSTTSPVYCSEDETFTCTETGRFRNPRDFSCQSYYYCYEWTNGTVGQYNYTCAVGLFNPDTHSCDPAYVCPCSDATAVSTVSTTSPVYCSEDETFTCTETGRFRNPRDFSCQSYYYCYEWTNGTIGQYNYTCAVGLFNPDTHSCDPAYVCPCSDATAVSTVSTTSPVYCSEDETFTCTETGRFRNPRDFSCQSYYYCYEWTNGTVGQYNYTCAVGLFNPDTHSCDPAYVCPCSDATAVSTVSTTSPVYCSEDETFTCTETGRFRNPRDFSCQSYYYCYEWTNGTVGQYNYTCAVGLFNPATHSCDPAYVCPCSDTTAVSTVSTTSPVYCSEDETFTCTETGRFRNPRDFSCQSYYYCYEWTNGTIGQYNYTCAVGLFNPNTHSCDPAYVCPCSNATAISTVSTTSPVYCSEDEIFTCTETGRFRNPTDFTCQSYYYCYEWTNGTVGQYNYTCAVGLFNPDTHSCDPAYVCPCSDATAVSTVSTTSPVYCSEDEIFTCTETGRFRNPRDFSCQSYYYCYEWTNGTIGQYNYTCAVGLFNPDTHSCDPAYVCPCSDATAVSTVSTTSPVYCSEDEIFTCTETGRFRNPTDFSCQSYYYCYEWTNGTVGQYNYTCAVGLFNPDTHSCDPAYVCPCTDNTAVSTTSITSTSEVTTVSTVSTTSSTTELTTISPTTPDYCSPNQTFTCEKTGYFRNPTDSTCRSYYYCKMLFSIVIIQREHFCLFGLFNPVKQRCDLWYQCPCSS